MPRIFPISACLTLAASGLAAPAFTAPARAAGAAMAAPASTSAGTAAASASASAALSGDERIVHALNRLGFGPRPGDVERVRAQGLGAWIEEQLHPERLDDSVLEASLKSLPLLQASASTLAVAQEYDTASAIKLLMALQTAQNKRPNSPRALKAQGKLRRAMATRKRGAGAGADAAMGADATMDEAVMAPVMEEAAAQDAAPDFANLPLAQQERARLISQRASAAGVERGDSARAVGELAAAKIARAVGSKRQLQEVLVDFWSNHFNLDVRKGQVRTLKVADERDAIRPHVLGRFRDLLGASAHSPAMLFYLDNVRSVAAQSQRGGKQGRNQKKPRKGGGGVNENYARELMELHTLGVDGGYTQQDVQEVARCLTGWSINRDEGTFQFNARAHDNGPKTVLGQTIAAGGGRRDGEQVLDILAAHPSTAKFLSRKLCERLVSDEPPQVLVDQVARKWVATGGDLRAVVAEIVYSPLFYARSTARSKIKSPFEFAASAVRALDAQATLPDTRDGYGATRMWIDGQSLLYAGKRKGGGQNGFRASLSQSVSTMGQPLYAYQAPTGYPEDSRRWVSSGALIARLNFALALSQGQIAHVQMPAQPILQGLSGDNHEAVLQRLNERLLSGAMTPATRATLIKQLKPGTPADPIKLTALVLGAPEFQRR